MLQPNISKLCYFVDVVLLIFYFLSYIVLQAKSPNRSILLNPIPYGEGSNTTPAPPFPTRLGFCFSFFCKSNNLDFNLHSLRNVWPIFENEASTPVLLPVGSRKRHKCQKLPKNESNKCWRQERGLITLGLIFILKSFILSWSTNLKCFKSSIYGSRDH